MSASEPFGLRIATYNIHKGMLSQFFGLRRQPVIHELRERLHQLDADLIMLQEVQGENRRHARRYQQWPTEPQDVFLSRSPELRHIFQSAYGDNASYLHGHHGNALLSRFPIVHRENRNVSDHALESRGILHCVLQINDQATHCFVVHFGLFARSRERQVDYLLKWVAESVPESAPLIIGGDFNDWRNRLSLRLCDSLGVVEAFDQLRPDRRVKRAARYVSGRLSDLGLDVEREIWPSPRRVKSARTFPSLIPWLRMDRIYVRGFHIRHADVLRGPAWARLSDHSPLLVDLDQAGAGHAGTPS